MSLHRIFFDKMSMTGSGLEQKWHIRLYLRIPDTMSVRKGLFYNRRVEEIDD